MISGSGKGSKTKSVPKPKAEQGPLIPGTGEPAQIWAKYLAEQHPEPAVIRERVNRLNDAKEYEHVIALIEATILSGDAQPWMYEVLGLTMQLAGRPDAQIERVLLSSVDFTAMDVDSMLFLAAYLTRFERVQRSLLLYQQASRIDPLRPEPYILGLKLAVQQQLPDAVEWAACGILQRAWTRQHDQLQHSAELAAAEARGWLEKTGDAERLNRFDDALAQARQRDLTIRLSWSGDADLDLVVEDPLGTECSFENRTSRGGGVLVHDGYGPNQKNTFELYVCPEGIAGDYRVKIRYAGGNVVAKAAKLTIIRYQGTPRQLERTRSVSITPGGQVIRISLKQGRRNELAPREQQRSTALSRPPRRPNVLQQIGPLDAGQRMAQQRQRRSRSRLMDNAVGSLTQTVGYNPIIRNVPEGIGFSAQGVVSADRRYVRLSVIPSFSTITDVFTFSFTGGGAGNGSTNQQPNP